MDYLFAYYYSHRATGLFMVDKCSAFTLTAKKTTVSHPEHVTHKKTTTFREILFLHAHVIFAKTGFLK